MSAGRIRTILGSWRHTLVAAAVIGSPLSVNSLYATGATRVTEGARPAHKSAELIAGVTVDRVVAPAAVYAALATRYAKIPAFSRQTGLACSACHYHFPQLTPFGRTFKLNGYTLTGLKTIGQPTDSAAGRETLKLVPIPGVSAMVIASLTHTRTAQPGTQNNTAALPDQMSIFLAGALTPQIGAFTQFTYAAADGAIGIDNLDFRYARHQMLGQKDWLMGLTLHNNPSVQDVWNTLPAWGYPFVGSGVAPSPIASTLLDGGLAQQVAGLGAYSLWDNALYSEFTVYRSAPQGTAMPLDSTAVNVPVWYRAGSEAR